MRALALLLVLSLQVLSLPTRGDAALQVSPDVPCLSEGSDPAPAPGLPAATCCGR
jgi:hypothetical protein